MHELSLATQIRETVLRAAQQHHVERVLEIDIAVGELSLFNPDQVEFWLHQLLRDTVAEGAKITVATIPPRIKCRACGYQGPLEVAAESDFHIFMPALNCPQCRSSEVAVEQGREVIIRNLKVHRSADGEAHA